MNARDHIAISDDDCRRPLSPTPTMPPEQPSPFPAMPPAQQYPIVSSGEDLSPSGAIVVSGEGTRLDEIPRGYDPSRSYDGGKGGAGVYQTIINQMPPHRVYIEPFLGGGAVMRHKRPAEVNIGLDLDPSALAMFGDAVPRAQVLQADALEWLPAYPWAGGELVYCDPPYLMETRSCQRPIYRHEMTDQDHWDLLEILIRLPCLVMVSGYWSEIYEDRLRDWRWMTFQTTNRAGRVTTESLWMNFPEPLDLHDYRFLGANFRERERIKRRTARWRARLARMPAQERHAMMAAVEELRGELQHRHI